MRKKVLLLALSLAAVAASLQAPRAEAGSCVQCTTLPSGAQCCVTCVCGPGGWMACPAIGCDEI